MSLGLPLDESGSPVGRVWVSCWTSLGLLLDESGSPVGRVWIVAFESGLLPLSLDRCF